MALDLVRRRRRESRETDGEQRGSSEEVSVGVGLGFGVGGVVVHSLRSVRSLANRRFRSSPGQQSVRGDFFTSHWSILTRF